MALVYDFKDIASRMKGELKREPEPEPEVELVSSLSTWFNQKFCAPCNGSGVDPMHCGPCRHCNGSGVSP